MMPFDCFVAKPDDHSECGAVSRQMAWIGHLDHRYGRVTPQAFGESQNSGIAADMASL
jgi:hypothetical protein